MAHPNSICSSPRERACSSCATRAGGASLAELLGELDRRYPGIRFRIINEQDQIRRHIKIFVNGEQAKGLAVPLRDSDEVMIVCALSGG